MGSDLSMRISYWTGWLDPKMVAVSKEVYQLLPHFPGSRVFGVSPKYFLRYSRIHRSFGVHLGLYPIFRHMMPMVERRFDVSHVYTSLSDWHFLNALGARPIVLTATENAIDSSNSLLQKVAHVAVETEPMAASAVRAGVPKERLSIIYPGVDLSQFRELPPPPQPWRCVFASSPENESELYTKGVDLLLDLAAAESTLELTILWRPFGRESDRALAIVRDRSLPNVKLVTERVAKMHEVLPQFHFAIAPFRSVGKPCPNSILESLAVGRPVLVSSYVEIASLIEREGVGIRFLPQIDELRRAFHQLCDQYVQLQPNARPCAERHFDLRKTVASYGRLYAQVSQVNSSSARL
ncbi:MAG: glycosyltransferase family 4 protein [Pirellulales bacterium]|nr:glycosyltransferase family 4 protein [Pirellulales bacterium]